MSCEILKAGTGETVCAPLSGLHQRIQRVHGETTVSKFLAKYIAVALLKKKRNDCDMDPLTGDQIHFIVQKVGLVQEDGIDNIFTKCADQWDEKKSLSAGIFWEYGNLDVATCVWLAEWFAEPGQYGVASAHQINAHLQQLELQRFISLHGLHNHKNLVHPTQSVLC